MIRRVAAAIGIVLAASVALVVLAGRWSRPPAPTGEYLRIGDTTLFVDDRGAGPPLVLIHGLGCSTYSWRFIQERLSGHRRVVAFDLPGWGRSERNPALPLDHDSQADRVAALMDHLGIESAVVFGHSMGGAIAQRFAVRHPGRLRALILISAVDASDSDRWVRGERRAGTLVRAVRLGSKLSPVLFRAGVRAGLRAMVADRSSVTRDMAASYANTLATPGTDDCLWAMFRAVSTQGPCDLTRVAAPTLVLSGSEDTVVSPRVGRSIAGHIPGARHVVLPHTGHFGAEETPGLVVDEVEGFLRAIGE